MIFACWWANDFCFSFRSLIALHCRSSCGDFRFDADEIISLSFSISLLHLFFSGIYVLQHCRLSTFGSVVLLSDRPLVQLSSVNVCKSLWAVGCVVNHWWRRWKQKWKQDSKWKDNFIQSYYLSHFAFWAQCAASCISRCFYGFELTNKFIYEAQVQQYNAY